MRVGTSQLGALFPRSVARTLGGLAFVSAAVVIGGAFFSSQTASLSARARRNSAPKSGVYQVVNNVIYFPLASTTPLVVLSE